MQVDIVSFEDCPSWRTTRQRLGDALACRLYPTAEALSGSPSVDDLADALTIRSRS